MIPSSPNARELTVEAVGPHHRRDRPRRVRPGPAPPRAAGAPERVRGRRRVRRRRDRGPHDRAAPARPRLPPGPAPGRPPRRPPARPTTSARCSRSRRSALPPFGAPPGDRASRATPSLEPRRHLDRLPRRRDHERPRTRPCPSCPALARRLAPRQAAPPRRLHRHRARRRRRRAQRLRRHDAARERPARLRRPRRARRARPARPRPDARARLDPRRHRPPEPRVARDARPSATACAATPSPAAAASPRRGPQVRGGPARATRKVKQHNRTRSFELALRVLRGPVCAARIELRGPGGVSYASGDVAAVRGRGQLVAAARARAACARACTACASRPTASAASAAASRPPSSSASTRCSKVHLTRRELVASATVAGALAAVPPAWARRLLATKPRVGPGDFLHGVASGEPTVERRHVLVAPGDAPPALRRPPRRRPRPRACGASWRRRSSPPARASTAR